MFMRLAAFSRAPQLLVCAAFILVMIDGYDMFIVSFVAPLIARDLHLAAQNLGAVFAAGLAGSVAGGLTLGAVADRVGRRPVLIVALAFAGMVTLLCSRANSFGAFAALRFLTGFALGGVLAAVVPLIAEYFPADRRNRAACARLAQPFCGHGNGDVATAAAGVFDAGDFGFQGRAGGPPTIPNPVDHRVVHAGAPMDDADDVLRHLLSAPAHLPAE
jgi:MFS transporter, AAHS family, 4-hydroxybenzoate transporter